METLSNGIINHAVAQRFSNPFASCNW